MDVKGFDIVVIGAGFAGLSAAVRAASRGARPLVVEARSRLGGRATAFADRETGALVDNGQHVLLGCYRETFAFLREIGAADNVRLDRQLAVTMIDRDGRKSRLSCPPLPPPMHLVAGVMEWSALSFRDRLSIAAMATPLRNARRELAGAPVKAASPDETVEQWLVRNGQTPRLREMLWHPLALAALNQPAERAAAPPFARVLAEMFGGGAEGAAIALPVTPLDAMYAEPARAYIERRGGEVRAGAGATVVTDIDGGAATGVRVGSGTIAAACVVSAVPWFAFAELFDREPPALRAMIERTRRMTASPIVSVNLWFDRPVFDEPFIGLPGRAMQWAFNKSEGGGAHDGHESGAANEAHVSLVSSGADAMLARTNDDLVRAAHDELLQALPASRGVRLLRGTVVREPRATFSLAPGQPPRPPAETGVKRLVLAGDWIDTGLPATIESAVRSGHRAAELSMKQ